MKDNMNTTELIKKHETLIEILGAVDRYQNRIEDARWNIAFGFIGQFPDLVSKQRHNIEIYKMCITRLEERYLNLIKQL